MDIKKASEAVSSGIPTAVQLAAINAQAKAKLTAAQVYVFSLRLCDDQVDRDFERFDTAALPELAKLFVGKSGIVDHRWSAEGQLARTGRKSEYRAAAEYMVNCGITKPGTIMHTILRITFNITFHLFNNKLILNNLLKMPAVRMQQAYIIIN